MDAAQNQIKLLQKHERGPKKVQTVYQGREEIGFWKTLNLDSPPKDAYQQIGEWSYLYIDVSLISKYNAIY